MLHANAAYPATDIVLRSATPGDALSIRTLVRRERLNRFDLQVENFKVAELDGVVVGAVQIRKHGDGARELGSLVIAPGFRGKGLAAALINAVLEDEPGPVFMITGRNFVAHYGRWRFAIVEARAAPPSIRFNFRMGRFGRVMSLLRRQPPRHLRILRRDPASPGNNFPSGPAPGKRRGVHLIPRRP
jgi:amino-acid N-acetyltransferase